MGEANFYYFTCLKYFDRSFLFTSRYKFIFKTLIILLSNSHQNVIPPSARANSTNKPSLCQHVQTLIKTPIPPLARAMAHSGVTVEDACVHAFEAMKSKRAYKYVTFAMSSNMDMIVVDKKVEHTSGSESVTTEADYEEFYP